MAYHPFPFLWEVYTTKKKNPVENKPTQWSFLREPTQDIDFTGSVTEGCFRKGAQCPWVTSLAETSKDLEIILITIVLSFSNSLSRLALILALRQVSFIQTSSVWLKLLQYVVTFKQANVYAHPQARARRRAQLLKITIDQLFHYCRLRQCYRVPFRLVIYRSFSSDFDGFSYLPKHSVTVVNPSRSVSFVERSKSIW